MIKDHKIVFCAAATNLMINNYYPVSKLCVKNVCKHNFVDEFMMINAGSTDDTVNVHNRLSEKVNFIDYPEVWETKNLKGCKNHSMWWDQTSFGARECLDRAIKGEKIIYILLGVEDIISDSFAIELEKNIEIMIDKKIDMDIMPWRKAITKKMSEIKFSRRGFGNIGHCILRFDKKDDALWEGYVSKNRNITFKHVKRKPVLKKLNYSSGFTNLDNWFFTKDNFYNKCKNHVEWGYETIEEGFNKKIKSKISRASKISYSDFFEKEIIDLIEKNLKEHHLGFDFFKLMKG